MEDQQQQDMWSFPDISSMLGGGDQPPAFDAGQSFPVPQSAPSAPSSYGRPDSALENSPYPPMDGPLKPQFSPDGGLEKVTAVPMAGGNGQSAGYGMGPGNEATGQSVFGADKPQYERFGDAKGWVMGPSSEDPNNYIPLPWAVDGARPMGPTLQAFANSDKWGADLDRRGTNLGPLVGSVLNRMGEIDAVNMKGQRYSPEYQQKFEQGWIDNARNNNLLTVRPEEQKDGSINRVYTYESGRQASERYQAPPPPKPTYGGGRGSGPGGNPDYTPAPFARYDLSRPGLGGGDLSGNEVPLGSRGGAGWQSVNQSGSFVDKQTGNKIEVRPGDKVFESPNGMIIERNGQWITYDKNGNQSVAPAPSASQKIDPTAYAGSTSATPAAPVNPMTYGPYGPMQPAPDSSRYVPTGDGRYYDNVERRIVTRTEAVSGPTQPYVPPTRAIPDEGRWAYAGNGQYFDKAANRMVPESSVPQQWRVGR